MCACSYFLSSDTELMLHTHTNKHCIRLGIFQTHYQDDNLNGYSPSSISWIFTFQLFLMFLFAQADGMFVDMFGPRAVMIPSAALELLGIAMLSLCRKNEYYQFFLAQGVCFGIGSAGLFMPGWCSLQYILEAKLTNDSRSHHRRAVFHYEARSCCRYRCKRSIGWGSGLPFRSKSSLQTSRILFGSELDASDVRVATHSCYHLNLCVRGPSFSLRQLDVLATQTWRHMRCYTAFNTNFIQTNGTQGLGRGEEVFDRDKGLQEEAISVIHTWWVLVLVSSECCEKCSKLKLKKLGSFRTFRLPSRLCNERGHSGSLPLYNIHH